VSYDDKSNELDYYLDEKAKRNRLCDNVGSSRIYFLIVKGESLPLQLIETGATRMSGFQGYDRVQTEEGVSDIKGHVNFSSISVYGYEWNHSLLAWFSDKESEDKGISLIDSIKIYYSGYIPFDSPVIKRQPEEEIARVLEGMVYEKYNINDFNKYPKQNPFVCARCHKELDWKSFKRSFDDEIYCYDCFTKANIKEITKAVIRWIGLGLLGLAVLTFIVILIIDEDFGWFLLTLLLGIGFIITIISSLVDKVKEKKKKRKGGVNEKD
jgi:hypothetical protein